MTDSDAKDFGVALSALAEIHGRDVSDPLTELYFQALSTWPLEDVKRAIAASAREDRFWPKPAELIERLGGGPVKIAERAAVAWTEVDAAMRRHGQYESVAFDDPYIAAAVEAMGGWLALFDITERDWPFRGKEFERLYAAFARTGRTGPKSLPGLHEIANGYQTRPPARIAATTPLPALTEGNRMPELPEFAPKEMP